MLKLGRRTKHRARKLLWWMVL